MLLSCLMLINALYMLFEVSLFQVIGLTELVRINRILALIANVDSTVQTLAPVSYTHLDGYKRQD